MEKALTEKDNNTTINVSKDDTITVRLSTNPSTGYVWQASGTTIGRVIEIDQSPPSNQSVIGSSGSVSFTFLVEKEGEIVLYYARPWSSNQPAKWFFVNVKTG